jgi:hypothetical protein
MKKLLILFAVILLTSCSNLAKVTHTKGFITEEEAKEIVAKDIIESAYYQKYYVTTSEKFDKRVYDITWGKTILVTIIPDGKRYTEEGKYYVLTGVLPSGQVLAAQTVDAYTGKLMTGSILVDENARKIVLISDEEAKDYAARYGYNSNNVEIVYYFDDDLPYVPNKIYCWKYCINTKNNRSIMDNSSKIGDFIFIDPWLDMERMDEKKEVLSTNAYFSQFKINHRAYKVECDKNATYRSLGNKNEEKKFVPID